MQAATRAVQHLEFRLQQAQRSPRFRRVLERAGSDLLSRPSAAGIEAELLLMCGEGGVFFEAGAADGFQESTTYWLERFHGCTGVLVEPMPGQFRACAALRTRSRCFNRALVPPESSGSEVQMTFAGLMSLVTGAQGEREERHLSDAVAYMGVTPTVVSATGRTISETLDDAGVTDVDLMTLDLEGFEGEALRGLDLDRHRPGYIVLEMHHPAEVWPAINARLAPHYTPSGWLTSGDFVYTLEGREPAPVQRRGSMTWLPSS